MLLYSSLKVAEFVAKALLGFDSKVHPENTIQLFSELLKILIRKVYKTVACGIEVHWLFCKIISTL